MNTMVIAIINIPINSLKKLQKKLAMFKSEFLFIRIFIIVYQ